MTIDQVSERKHSLQRVFFIDALRAAAIIGVVVIHGLDQILRFNTDYASVTWWYANIVNSSVRWVLPAFFMISGLLLLSEDEDVRTFLTKRLNRIIVPTVVWSGIYGLWVWMQYNHELTLKEHLISTFIHAQLIIMGDGPERRVLESLADQLQVASSVHFSGALQHKEVLKVMKRSHVFSLPSSVEGFGLASIEAAACGLPYVSADIPATREITRNGMGGYLYPVRDFQILAQKLVRLLTDAVVYQEKSQEVSTLAQNYDWKRIVSETESVYQSTLKT